MGLTVNTCTNCATTTSTISPTACVSYTSPSGKTINSPGTHLDTLVNTGGCDSIITILLTINQGINTTGSATICSNDSVSIHGVFESTAGVYSGTFTAANGCDSVSDITLTVNTSPVVSFVADTASGCGNVCVNFTNTGDPGTSVTWRFGDGNSSTAQNPSNCYSGEGAYDVTLIVIDNGCVDSSTTTGMVTVHPQPVASYTADPTETTIATPIVAFTDYSTGAKTWDWSFGDVLNSSSNEQHPTYEYQDTGTFHTQLTVTNEFGCTDTALSLIHI